MQIILIIITLVVFAIIAWWLGGYFKDSYAYAEDTGCRLSILARATTPSSLKGPVSLIPLKCKTSKICITTERNGECEQFIGEEGIKVVKIPDNNAQEAADIIEKVHVESMYSCWNTMGRGNFDLFTQDDLFTPDWYQVAIDNIFFRGKPYAPSCIFCSDIALDKDLVYIKQNEKFTTEITSYFQKIAPLIDVADYIQKTNIPLSQSKTYLQDLTDVKVSGYPFSSRFTKDLSPITNVVDQTRITFIQLLSPGGSNPFENSELFSKEKIVPLDKFIAIDNFILSSSGETTEINGILSLMLYLGSNSLPGSYRNKEDFTQLPLTFGSCSSVQNARQIKEGDDVYGCSLVRSISADRLAELNNLCFYPIENDKTK